MMMMTMMIIIFGALAPNGGVWALKMVLPLTCFDLVFPAYCYFCIFVVNIWFVCVVCVALCLLSIVTIGYNLCLFMQT